MQRYLVERTVQLVNTKSDEWLFTLAVMKQQGRQPPVVSEVNPLFLLSIFSLI